MGWNSGQLCQILQSPRELDRLLVTHWGMFSVVGVDSRQKLDCKRGRLREVEAVGVDHTGEVWQSEGPRKRVELQGSARLSDIKFMCLKRFADINFTLFFLIGKRLLKKKIILTERN